MILKKNNPIIAKTIGDIKKILDKNSIKNKTILLACSGGQDSIALLMLLNLLKTSYGLNIIVGHIHHGLRKESDDEEIFVKNLAIELGLIFEVRHLELTKSSGWIDKARSKRYEALNEIAKKHETNCIFLAHTQTDNIETFLMHLIRGCGLNGLEGIRDISSRGGFVYVRPLLLTARSETEEICKIFNVKFVKDPTNVNEEHLRIRLRQKIVPLLEFENPNFCEAVNSLIEQVKDTNDYIVSKKKIYRFILLDDKDGLTFKVINVNDSVVEFINDFRILLNDNGVDISEIKYFVYKNIYSAFLKKENKVFNVKPFVILFVNGKNSELRIQFGKKQK